MAENKAVNVTLLDDAPQRKPKSSNFHGRVRVQTDTYNTGGTNLATGDTVVFARLPKGAVVLGGKLDWEALTATASKPEVTIGDSHDSDRFMRATRLGTLSSDDTRSGLITGAGTYSQCNCGIFNTFDWDTSDAPSNRTGAGYEYTCTKDIILTVTNDTITAGWLRCTVFYATE